MDAVVDRAFLTNYFSILIVDIEESCWAVDGANGVVGRSVHVGPTKMLIGKAPTVTSMAWVHEI